MLEKQAQGLSQKLSAEPGFPERLEISMGVGHSAVATASAAVGSFLLGSQKSTGKAGARSQEANEEHGQVQHPAGSGDSSQKQSKERPPEIKNKLKAVLSSAKSRSSVTFVTLYSILSNSLDKLMTGKTSQRKSEEDKTQLSSKASKRVTISGVVKPLSKGSLATPGSWEPLVPDVGLSPESRTPTAPEPPKKPSPSTEPSSPEKCSPSAAPHPQKKFNPLATHGSSKKSKDSEGMELTEVAPLSVSVGPSLLAPTTIATGSNLGNTKPSETGGQVVSEVSPREQSDSQHGSISESEPSRVPITSVAVERSEPETLSVAVEPSVLGHTNSTQLEEAESRSQNQLRSSNVTKEADAPSATAAQHVESRDVAREAWRMSAHSVAHGPSEKSRVSGTLRPQAKSKVSAAFGHLEVSRVSVAVGCSEVGLKSSVNKGRSKNKHSSLSATARQASKSRASRKAPKKQGKVKSQQGSPSCSEEPSDQLIAPRSSKASMAVGLSEPAVALSAVGPSQGPSTAWPLKLDSNMRNRSEDQWNRSHRSSMEPLVTRVASSESWPLGSHSHSSYALLLRLKASED
ncbi:hypothetical protein Y1Q_0010085 [Alligator mississippiensis]|uniref:Uncharacterized protein n=1 Tax=Alligator mississippiensis TaxID=8496 RepID=A0A151MG75_ALLMI|nr:hypothetical protein Y1Q_0010085 [Alligator mississippiensis]